MFMNYEYPKRYNCGYPTGSNVTLLNNTRLNVQLTTSGGDRRPKINVVEKRIIILRWQYSYTMRGKRIDLWVLTKTWEHFTQIILCKIYCPCFKRPEHDCFCRDKIWRVIVKMAGFLNRRIFTFCLLCVDKTLSGIIVPGPGVCGFATILNYIKYLL